MKIAGLILIVVGILGLVYGGVTMVYPDKVVDAGPIEITVDKKKSLPLPPLLGVVSVGIGIGFLAMGSRK